jgi:putative NIF3 family GTP cyclohydrolase 1 type 2
MLLASTVSNRNAALIPFSTGAKLMKARDLHAYLLSLNVGWVNLKQTVDTFKAGDPETEIRGIAVGWMSYSWALRRALELGCNAFITHEPTYYDHYDNKQRIFEMPGVREKQRWVEESGLVILRCHDVWDQVPEIGIPASWGDWLALGPCVAGKGYYRVYDVSGKTALQVAQQVARRVQHFGQDAVELVGAPNRPVTRVAIGTGAITPYLDMLAQYGVDLAICTDDGFTYWRDAAYAIDNGLSIIIVNHAVSEEAGLMNLAKLLQEKFKEIPVHHIPQKCMFQWVRGSE